MNGSRQMVRTELFQNIAHKMGRNSTLVDINVFFGNDFANPLPQGVQDRNHYGALQTSCTYCGECDVGCNYHAKNTLDLNYLHRARQEYKAVALTEHLVEHVVPTTQNGDDDPEKDGVDGFNVYYRDLRNNSRKRVWTNRVILAAGSMGSTELLLRCRDIYRSLKLIKGPLGQYFSGNGDFLSFILGSKQPADPNHGPVITQSIDFNLFEHFDRNAAFILQDAGFPNCLSWFAEGAKPGFLRLNSLWRTLRHVFGRIGGQTTGPIGYAFADLMSDNLSDHTCILLCMGYRPR